MLSCFIQMPATKYIIGQQQRKSARKKTNGRKLCFSYYRDFFFILFPFLFLIAYGISRSRIPLSHDFSLMGFLFISKDTGRAEGMDRVSTATIISLFTDFQREDGQISAGLLMPAEARFIILAIYINYSAHTHALRR